MKKGVICTLAALAVIYATSSVFAAENLFADVPRDHWAYQSITKLTKDGIIQGDGTNFNGDRVLTRYEMAALVANAITKEDKADAASKVEIAKLEQEFSSELTQLGIKIDKVEKKVNNIGNVKFNFWGRVLMNTYKDSATKNANMDSQYRYKLKMTSQLQDNVWVQSSLGYDQGYNTGSTSNSSNSVALQTMYIKVKNGNWYYNFGRQGSNASSPVDMLATGMTMAAGTNFDGLSTYYVDPKNSNNKFFIGQFNKAVYYTNAASNSVRNITILNANYDILPKVNLTAAYFKDGGRRGIDDSSLAEITTIGATYKISPKYTLVGEYGRNQKAKAAAAAEGVRYNGSNDGWDVLLQYGHSNIEKPKSWDVSVDLRRMQPGFEPYAGTEWLGGVYSPINVGATSNVDNVKGVGVYWGYVPYKNVWTQLSWYYLAPVEKGQNDGKYRQGVRLMVDFRY